MNVLDNLTDQEIGVLLASELAAAPPVVIRMEAAVAFHIAALLQMACRHPLTRAEDREIARDMIRQLGQIGPATTATLEMGWDRSKDRE